MRTLFKRFGRRPWLLLLLAAALAGFFVLIDLLVSLTSSGPSDLLAVNPSDEESIPLPNGVTLFTFAVAASAVVIGVVALAAPQHWTRRGWMPWPRRSLAIGGLLALALTGGGLYLALSGVLSPDFPYEQHQARREWVKPLGLVVLAAIFLSVAAVGILKPRLLLLPVLAWLAVALGLGWFESSALAGLRLFERPARLEVPWSYAAEVETYRRAPGPSQAVETVPWDVSLPLETGGVVLSRGDSQVLFVPGTTALPTEQPVANPLFTVTGAAHTSYLRSATGDRYENGAWVQLEPSRLRVGPWSPVPMDAGAVPGPRAAPESLELVRISVSPAGELDSFVPGLLPTSLVLRKIGVGGVYLSGSATFLSEDKVEGYEWESEVPLYSDEQLQGAGPATAPPFLQLPDGLHPEIRTLAKEITEGLDSPYEKARAIEQHLMEEYDYSFLPPGSELELAPEGRDPAEWFLFDSRSGSCGSFTTAFVLLARAAGIPSRLVSGWAIADYEGAQTVYSDQAHQWSEVALDGVGWVTFDPTPGGAPARVRPPAPPEEPPAEDPDEETPPPDEERGEEGEILVEALAALAEGADPETRTAAAQLLGEIGADVALPVLVEALFNDPFPGVRETALVSLSEWDLETLIAILLEHESPLMRAGAAHALGERGDSRALESMLRALAEDADTGVRTAVAEALGELGDAGAAPGLAAAMEADEAAGVRAAAAVTLGKLLDYETLPALLRARDGDESPAVRVAAGEALDRFRGGLPIDALLESPNPETRRAAAQLLGERGSPSAVTPLIRALSDTDQGVRSAAAAAMEELGEMTRLETGGALLTHRQGIGLVPGVTTAQAAALPHVPVFTVSGADRTDFLRTAVGDEYLDGVWVAKERAEWDYSARESLPSVGVPGEPLVSPAQSHLQRLEMAPAGDFTRVPAGVMPTSYSLRTVSLSGIYRPDSLTFLSNTSPYRYSWESAAPEFSEARLAEAQEYVGYQYRQLPEGMPQRVAVLALQLTAGHDTAYAKAKAIEGYLRANYTYRLADPQGNGGPPPDRDPVDWFLFESREGTCGNFSSAFVVLARAVGLPARVVAGWAINSTGGRQTVYADQAHQRAEVAFRELGWVAFEPTAPGGAPDRAAEYTRADEESLLEDLSSDDEAVRDQAMQALLESDGWAVQMENGSVLVTKDDRNVGMATGTTTRQATQPPRIPVFVVSGAAHTNYLRAATGDLYEGERWRQLDPVSLDYAAFDSVPHLVGSELALAEGAFAGAPEHRLDRSLLVRHETASRGTLTVRISLSATSELGAVPAGIAPVSRFLDRVEDNGTFRPYSGTFSLAESTNGYRWVSRIPDFSVFQLNSAEAASDPTYTQLPDGLPARIRQLALEITGRNTTPYAKAKALETYLSTRYTYRFADGSGREAPPPGRDPVDWFLFDHQEGTCGVFSSAFVVLARSVGIPARVASGWAIAPMKSAQTVGTDQAHQWAEVALDGVGWVTFEPTAPGGPAARVPPPPPGTLNFGGADFVADTVTTITQWPQQVRRQSEYTVDGTVTTLGGWPVSEMEVEIFVNETKEHGGIEVGIATVRNGVFRARVQIPASLQLGPYQLIAHAVENDDYAESWSDPDISVYSETGFELSGPAEVPVDVQAVFRGRLTEDNGRALPDQDLQVTVDQRTLPPAGTGPGGDFSFASIFGEPGAHIVEVEFLGTDFLTGNSARLQVTATMPTSLALDGPTAVAVGDELEVSGVLLDARSGPMEGREITIGLGNGATQTVQTGRDGRFEITGSFESADEYLVEAVFAGEYPVLPAEGSFRVVARHLTTLAVDGPRAVDLGNGASFAGRITSATLPAIGPLELTLTDGDGAQLATVTTGEDGSFEYRRPSLDATGPQSLTVRFPGAELLTPSSASVAFSVLAPTELLLGGPRLRRTGEPGEWHGLLRRADGEPVPEQPVKVGGESGRLLLTGEDGGFIIDIHDNLLPPEAEAEVPVRLQVNFEGTAHLAPALAEFTYTVGIPRVVVETPEPVARGEAVMLRGTALIGTRPAAGVGVTIGPDILAETNEAGVFTHQYRVPEDAALGATSLAVEAAEIEASASATIDVRSASRLIVTPLEDVRPDRVVMLQASLVDDRGIGIPQATIRSSQGRSAVTDEQGVALLELTVPETGGLLAVPVTFRFEGNGRNMPLTYFLGVPVTPASFNWLLWVGLPALVLATAGAAYTGRRLRVNPLPVRFRRSKDEAPAAEPPELEEAGEPLEPEPVVVIVPTLLEVEFETPAPDLPPVWGPGEEVSVRLRLLTEEGGPVGGAELEAAVSGEHPATVATGDDGACGLVRTATEPGDFEVFVRFDGDKDHLPSSGAGSFRVVDFREEIVRLYNDFVGWGQERTPDLSGQATPREVEAMIVRAGLPVDQKALDEIISRFEEADYSEHLIARRHYESMYRAWRTVVEG